MSLTVNQRPSTTISGETSRWNAVGNPILYKMQRKDFVFNQINNNGGDIQIQINSTDVSSSFVVGDTIYIQSDNGVYDLFAEVTASSFSTNTLVTVDAAYISAAPGGFTNNDDLRPLYRLEVEVYDSANTLLNASPFVYSPTSKGVLTIDVSAILRANLSPDNDADLTGDTEIFNDTNVWKEFYIKYKEVWTGSAESQTNDSANQFFVVLAAMQIPSTYGGNLFDYLIFENMKKATVTISSAEILTGNSVPVTIIPAVAGKVIVPVSFAIFLDFNSVAYATNTTFDFYINGVAVSSGTISSILTGTADRHYLAPSKTIGVATNLINEDLYFQVISGDPTAGNSPIKVEIEYFEHTP